MFWIRRYLRQVYWQKGIEYKLGVFLTSDYLAITTLKITVQDEAQEETGSLEPKLTDVNSWTISSIEHSVHFATHQDSLSGSLWILGGRNLESFQKNITDSGGSQGIHRCRCLRRYLVSSFTRSGLKCCDCLLVFLLCCFRLSEQMFLNVFNNTVVCNSVHTPKEPLKTWHRGF